MLAYLVDPTYFFVLDESKDFLESQSFIIHLAGESPENLESSQNINDLHRASNNTADNCGDDSLKSNKEERTEVELVTGIGNEIDKEPLVIPESPLKYPQPTCVGMASICEITPFSSGLMFPLTPPQAKLLTVNQPTLIQTSLNPSDFEIPAPILNRRLDLQKTLRQRFRVPHAITPSEKKNRRTIMCTLRSRRRLKQSSWKVHENTYLKPVNLSPGHQLFIETGSDQSSSFSQIALYLSPDIENYAPTLVTPNPPEVVEKQNLNQKNSIETNVSTTPQRQTSLLKNDGAEKEDTPEELKNENTYSELKKSMEGNLLGCEASLSDVELMDEIESSLNLEGEEDDASYLSDPVVYIDPLTMSCKTKNLPETVSTMLPTSNTSGTTIETSCEPAKVLNSLNGKEIIKNTQNQTGLQEQVERRRSSRLAGIPALPLKYTSEPLPNRNKSNNRKPLLKRPDSSIEQRNESKATTPAKKQPESIIDVPQLIPEAKNEPQNTRVSWQEVRLLLPPCWATILENHVKAHHSDETMRFQGILGARCPTVYCECTPTQKRYTDLSCYVLRQSFLQLVRPGISLS